VLTPICLVYAPAVLTLHLCNDNRGADLKRRMAGGVGSARKQRKTHRDFEILFAMEEKNRKLISPRFGPAKPQPLSKREL